MNTISYEQAVHFAQTWGLVFATTLFVAAIAYALWPGNGDRFSRAARAPLDHEDDNG